MADRMTLYKDNGDRTFVCSDEDERNRKLLEGWWETPLWQRDPRPHGLVQENPYEKIVMTPFQEYPRTVHKPKGKTLTVKDDREKAIALKGGWTLVPVMEPVAEADPVPAA